MTEWYCYLVKIIKKLKRIQYILGTFYYTLTNYGYILKDVAT